MYNEHYLTAQDAFEDLYRIINTIEPGPDNTRKLHNVGIVIHHPWMNVINTECREWGKGAANKILQSYLNEPKAEDDRGKHKAVLERERRCNLGHIWRTNDQLKKVVSQLRYNPNSREAWITFYDGKKKDEYETSAPRTLNIGFTIDNNFLCMSVLERDTDLWYGFCNDQYVFSELQRIVSGELRLDMGWFYYYASEMSLTEKHFHDVF